MRKIIAIGGVPATGKSSLVKSFIQAHSPWNDVEPIKLVNTLYNEEANLHVLGHYPEGEPFGGTDRYSMAVQPQAVKFVQENPNCNILFEGDRLFNQSFLEFLADQPDTEFQIKFLSVHQSIIEARHISRADTQTEVFKKGRQTKIENLQSNMVLMGYCETWNNATGEQLRENVEKLNKEFFV